eukprot:3030566-Rhodomonas_salina.1
MERAIEVLFPSEVAVVPRTEELSNVVLLHIADAAAFLLAAQKLDMIDDFEQGTLPCTKVSVQVTKVGHVKLRLSWGDTFSVQLQGEVAEADVLLKSIGTEVEKFLKKRRMRYGMTRIRMTFACEDGRSCTPCRDSGSASVTKSSVSAATCTFCMSSLSSCKDCTR